MICKWKALLVAVCVFFQQCSGYPQMAGNCNGLYGMHLPNSLGGGNGGYLLQISDASVASSGDRRAKVVIQHLRFLPNISQEVLNKTLGTGLYSGFLLKSYDPYTGLPLGQFGANAELPPNTMLYVGCIVPESAITHTFTSQQILDGVPVTNTQLEIPFSWPAARFDHRRRFNMVQLSE